MEGVGFKRGKSTPCAFHHQERNIRAVVHGDDFTVLAYKRNLDWFLAEIKGKSAITHTARLGPEDIDDKTVSILNRSVTWKENEIRVEADQRPAEIIIKDTGMNDRTRPIITPGLGTEDKDTEELLDGTSATMYRACVSGSWRE